MDTTEAFGPNACTSGAYEYPLPRLVVDGSSGKAAMSERAGKARGTEVVRCVPSERRQRTLVVSISRVQSEEASRSARCSHARFHKRR
jgi:hypothetical protein